jgi:F0F1-type ATP synthase membrane subunit c/vacuolar-type H+-ATPase subunit K
MEQTNNSNLMKSTMTSGAILGAALLIYTLVLYMTNLTFSSVLGYVSYLIMIGGIVLGIKNFRDQEQQGFITYGRAIGIGMLTVLFASIIMAVFIYLLYTVIDPGLIEKAIEFSRNKMAAKNLTDDQIEAAINMTKKFMTPAFMVIGTIIGYGFFGLIFSLIISAFMKKEKGVFSETLDNPQQ